MAHKVRYKPGILESAFTELYGGCTMDVQVVIKYIPPHSSARLGFEQGIGTRKVVRIQVETHHTGGVDHFSDLMYVCESSLMFTVLKVLTRGRIVCGSLGFPSWSKYITWRIIATI